MLSMADLNVTALVATKDRNSLLMRALTSISGQTRPPKCVVIINDGDPFSFEFLQRITDAVSPTAVEVLPSSRNGGAAGAWNTGLDYLARQGAWRFVAILDDDDEWDALHLEACAKCASSTGANIVVSGLRRIFDGEEAPRELPSRFADRDFLCGNPGWQGSNTFVQLDLLAAVGGFREGLRSLNDRDLAIRLLRHPNAKVGFTGAWTANWHHRGAGTLSAPRSPEKIAGLRWFWWLYGGEMSDVEATEFFRRAADFFGVSRAEIVDWGADLPVERKTRGDLNALALK